MTKNNTVTKIDIRLDGVFLFEKKKKGFPWVARIYLIGTNENIFVTGFADHHFYYLSTRIESLGFDS